MGQATTDESFRERLKSSNRFFLFITNVPFNLNFSKIKREIPPETHVYVLFCFAT